MNQIRQGHLAHTLGTALSVFDPPTGGHCMRVAVLADQIAAQLGLGNEARATVRQAGLLHDIGKMAIDPNVLNSPGPLSEQEWAAIRRHPGVGADMLLAISSDLGPIAAAVRSHHERFDGGGYPDGLVGNQIPHIGRIVAVADVYDALTCVRSYRCRSYSRTEAWDYLTQNAGKQFDDEVVSAAQAVLGVAI